MNRPPLGKNCPRRNSQSPYDCIQESAGSRFSVNRSSVAQLRRFWREDGVFLALMLALFALRFWPAFAHGELYAPFQDNLWLYGPLFSRASEIALTGNFPYWLDTVLGGFPLYQTPHFSATYPFYFFGLLNYGKAVAVLYMLSYVTCFHGLILYLNLYVLLRVAGARGLASLCGATIGLVSGNTEVSAHWIVIAAAWSWFPLFVAGMILLLRAPLSFASIALFSLSAALICTANPAQPVIQSAFVCALFFTAAVIWRWFKEGVGAAGRLLLGLSIAATIVFALTAVAFVPMTLGTGTMIRHLGSNSHIIGHASIPWERFNEHQLAPKDLTHLFFDSSDLHVIGGIYVGPLALLGILLCVVFYRRADTLTRFLLLTFGAIAFYFLLAGFGTHFGLAYVHFHLPLLNRIREAGRYLAVFTVLTACLAGLGLQAIMDVANGKLQLKRRWSWYFWIAMGLGLIIFVVALVFDRHEKTTSWLVLAMLPLAWMLWPTSSRRERLVAIGLLLLACLASVLSPPGTQRFWVSEYLRADNLRSHRVLRRVAQLPDIAQYRVVVVDSAFRPVEWGSNASYYGIRTFYLNCTPVPYDQFQEMFPEREINLRMLRGTKYFICGQGSMPFDPKARLLFTESGYRVYEASDPMELYTLVHKVIPFATKDSFRSKLAAGFDYHRAAAIEKSKEQTISPPLRANEQSIPDTPISEDLVEPIFHTPNVFGVQANSSRPGLLILNERWSDDWHARVNSRPAKILRANFTQLAVVLPAGGNYVEFEFKPTLFWRLLVLQRTIFLVLVVVGGWKLLRAWLLSSNSQRPRGAVPA